MRAKPFLLSALTIVALNSYSQTPANTPVNPALQPGQALEDKIKQEQRSRRKQQLQQEQEQQEGSSAPSEQEQSDSGPRFLLNSVQFSHSDYLNRDDLISVLKNYVGKEINFGDLQRMLKDIDQLYRDKGVYTAKALLPQQQIKDGVVRVTLLEGKLDKIVFQGNEYTADDDIRPWISYEDSAEVLDSKKLESDLLIYNRVVNQRLQAELQAGETFGLTDIVIHVDEPKRDYFEVFVDNWGYESSGEDELGALYQRQKVFFSGDRALAYLLASEGTKSLSLGYNTPIATSKWRLGSTFSYTQTEVVGSEFKVLDTEGESHRLSIDASHLSYSAPQFWLNSLVSFNYTRSVTEVGAISGVGNLGEIANSDTYQLQLGAEFNWFGPAWQISMRDYLAVSEFKDNTDAKDDQSVVALIGSLDWLYAFDYGFYLQQQLGFQYTNREGVKGALSFTAGGPATVRAYTNGALSGDTGWYQQLEVHNTLLSNSWMSVDAFMFYDAATVKNNASIRIESAGLGFVVSDGKWLTLNVSGGRTLKRVLPDQDEWGVYARLSCTCLP